MKKFIVEFDYEGIKWTARVDIIRMKTAKGQEAIMYSVHLVEDCLSYFFFNKVLVFEKVQGEYELRIFKGPSKIQKGQFASLPWRIRNEIKASTEIQHEKKFSDN